MQADMHFDFTKYQKNLGCVTNRFLFNKFKNDPTYYITISKYHGATVYNDAFEFWYWGDDIYSVSINKQQLGLNVL